MRKKITVAIIPARGGSKAIPRKNLIELGGLPLIAWPINLAKSIPAIDRIIVSSDDEEIMRVAREYGAEVLFKRPKSLSKDSTSTFPVLKHAIKYLISKEKYAVDNVVLLYPTTPFLKKERIEQGIEVLNKDQADSVIGVRKVRGVVWKKSRSANAYKQYYPKNRMNRQLFTHLFEEAGNIYLTKSDVLLQQNQLVNENCSYLLEIEENEVLDIDSIEDFKKAQLVLKNLSL